MRTSARWSSLSHLRLLPPALVVALASLVGCGSDDASSPAVPPKPDAGTPGDGGCPPGEATLEDGSCRPAGVPAEGCAQGFEADGHGGCVAVLPDAACPKGQLALPGETVCRPVMECGAAPWGNLELDAMTQFVDANYTGGGSDGTEAKPWTTIQAGIDAAVPGGLVAVAAGAYLEDLDISGSPVRVRGRCPDLVDVAGTGVSPATVIVGSGASASEVGGLSLRGSKLGVVVSGSEEVLLEQVWVHDVGGRGIDVENFLGPASAIVRGALVESAHDAGIIALTAEVTVEQTSVRDTKPGGSLGQARGIVIRREQSSMGPAKGTVRSCLVERVHDFGVQVQGSDLTMEATLLRDTDSNASTGEDGLGIDVEIDPATGRRSTVAVLSTVVERSHDTGVFVDASDATFENVVVRDTLPRASDQAEGTGFAIQNGEAAGQPAKVSILTSLVAGSRTAGVHLIGSELDLDSTVIESTLAQASDKTLGRGLNVVDDPGAVEASHLTMRSCLVDDNREIGIVIGGSEATIEHTLVRGTLAQESDGRLGRGIEVQRDVMAQLPATVTLRASALEGNRDVSIAVVGSDVTIEDSAIRDTLPRDSDQGRGRAIAAQAHIDGTRAHLTVRGGVLEHNSDVAISVFASDATIENVTIRDTKPRPSDGLFGDGLIVDRGTATVTGTRIEGSARTGIGNFSGSVVLGSTVIECAQIPLDGESGPDGAPTFEDQGGNACGCAGNTEPCKVLSSNVQPPDPVSD